MSKHESINYVEFPSNNLSATKEFFKKVFGWSFEDYGPEYTAFADAGLEGGFFKADQKSSTENGAALIIFYSNDLEATQAKIQEAGGKIIKPIFSFPGGRRFHFTEPSGNELAVWSDQ
ncbi:VOC family protein [Aliifodinibius salicampi]|uniref:VOC family protein n=1 Tax=Fodinibius salicampi TaxID=1920655 RepID=A0ABT3Q1E2_9BACT|nr:VOC family protein [Fodinibius salicampi]MCW9713918.1 VOC family protein [Fodinibius salicampi]